MWFHHLSRRKWAVVQAVDPSAFAADGTGRNGNSTVLCTQQYHDVVTYALSYDTTLPWCCDLCTVLCTQHYHDVVSYALSYAHNNTMMLWRGWSVWNPVCRALEWPFSPLPWSKSTMTKGAVTLRRKVKGVWVPLDSIRLRVLSDSFRICIKDNTSINSWYNTLKLHCAFL